MSMHRTGLKDVATNESVDAELHDQVGLEAFFEAEAHWAPHRVEILRQHVLRRVPVDDWPEHWHWNWAQKAANLRNEDIGNALSPTRAMGIQCEKRWEGLILLKAHVKKATRLMRSRPAFLYGDYLETAPWNLELKVIGQSPRFSGVGVQLLAAAAQLSRLMGLRGRIGLHSLRRSEDFYRRRGMTDLGPDPEYENLRYFELTEEQAQVILHERR